MESEERAAKYDRRDIEQVRAFLRAKRAAREAKLAAALGQARTDAARIIDRLVREVDPQRVYQWGSLVAGRHFSEISDIDVALEGLAGPEAYFRAIGIAMEETTFPVDIIELEKVDPPTRERIRRNGRLIYERKQ